MSSARVRTYTFQVICPLPSSKEGEAKNMTSFVYGATSVADARVKWFAERLAAARKNGLRGPTEQLKKSLNLSIERTKLSELVK